MLRVKKNALYIRSKEIQNCVLSKVRVLMEKLNLWQRGALNVNDVHRPIYCRLLYLVILVCALKR